MMYLFKIFFLSIIGFILLGCASRGYPPHKEVDKDEFPLQLDTSPSSVHETVGRYRKDGL